MKKRRDWLSIGAEYHEGETRLGDNRRRVVRAIAGLEWQPVPEDGTLSVAMMPGLAIQECIAQLGLPRVSAVATNGYLTMPDGPETAHYSVYGIEANYANGRARVYVLDTGGGVTPLAADFWEKEPVAA